MKPSQAARNLGSHVLLFGEPKTGKSTLVSKLLLSGEFKLWWFSLDNGHDVVYKHNLSQEALDERLELFIIPDTYAFPIAFQTIKAVSTGGPVEICDKHGAAGCSICKKVNDSFSRICLNEFSSRDILVIDHATQLTVSCMNRLTKELSEEKRELYKPSYTDYMNQGTMLDSILSNFQHSKANIIVITHTIESELEDGAKKLVPAIGTGNFSRNSAKYFGHVVYIKVANKAHKVGSSTTYETNVITGSRSDICIESMKEPSLEDFFNGRILKQKKVENEHGSNILALQSAKFKELGEPVASKQEPSTGVIEQPSPTNLPTTLENSQQPNKGTALSSFQQKLAELNSRKKG